MKTSPLLFVLLLANFTFGQVKIGANIDSIDGSSLVELESDTKVFVVTRVSTVQMNAITPLNGALIYNTDDDCLFQYRDNAWQSLCVNVAANETVTTISDNNNGTFTYLNEATASVSISKANLTDLGDGTYSFDNNSGSSIIIDTNAGSNPYDGTTSGLSATTVQQAIDQLASGSVTGTGDITSTDLTVGGDLNALLGNVTLEIAANAVTNTEILNETILSDDILDGTITNSDVANNAINSVKILNETILSEDIVNGTIATADVADDAIDATKINADVAGAGLTQNASGALDVNVATITGEDLTPTDASITINNGIGATIIDTDISVATDGITNIKMADNAIGNAELLDDAVTTTEILNETILSEDILDGAIVTADIADDAIVTAKIADDAITTTKITPGTNNQSLITNNAGTVTWVDSSTLDHTGTPGSLFFANDSDGSPTENNSQLFWDNTLNRMGIGTNSPTHKLQVTGQVRATSFANANGTAGAPSYRFNSDANTGMFLAPPDQLAFSSGGNEALRIDNSSNVGIGISTPDESLHVANNMRLDGSFEDKDGEAGTTGQILTSTATGTDWTNAPYEKIVIWAEENAALANNQLEWSFGNGATGRIGIPLPEDWEAYAVSFNSDTNGATDSVLMAIVDSNTNTNLFTFTATGNINNMVYTEMLAVPVAIPAGTSIGFRTVTETGDVRDARVAVFLRRRP